LVRTQKADYHFTVKANGEFQDRCRIDCLREIFRHRIIAGHFETNLGGWT
jgi:hypothetical protein